MMETEDVVEEDCTIPENDIHLVAGNEVLGANKHLLSESSSYFAAMFRSNMKECSLDTITIYDIAPGVLKSLIDYSRHEGILLSMKTVYEILNAACMLQFKNVIDECTDFLLKRVDASNCLTTVFVAARNGLQEIYPKVRRYALWYFSKVQDQEDFLHLPVEGLIDYLSDDMLNIKAEGEVVAAALKWLSYDEERLFHVPEVLSAVRLGLLSEEELQLILRNEIIEKSPESVMMIGNVLQCRDDRNSALCNIPENFFQSRHVQKNIFLIGGLFLHREDKVNNRNISLYDEKEKKLRDIYKNIPPFVAHQKNYVGLSACGTGKDIYLCGGEVALGRDGWQMDMWKFDTFQETWECVSQLPQPRRHFSLVAMDSELYLIGGFGRHRVILDVVDVYNYETCTWSSAPSLNSAVYSAAACRHKDQIYVIKHEIETYKPGDPKWTRITVALPFEIGIHQCVSYQSKIYLLGAYMLNLIEFDVSSSTLKTLGKFKDACGAAVLLDNVIYVLSGNESDLIESYDLVKEEFAIECKLEIPICNHSVVTVVSYVGCERGIGISCVKNK